MRISIVLGPFLPVPPVLGGAVEKVHLLLAEAYVAAGHDVTIMSRQYADLPLHEVVNGVHHIRVRSRDRVRSDLRNFAADLLYSFRVARRLPPSDITVTNSLLLPLVLRRTTAARIYVHVARYPKHQMFLYSRADRLQSISHAVARAIVRQTPGLAGKVVTIGYPVPTAYFQAAKFGARRETILFVGRIAREKGVHLLLKAMRLLSGAKNAAVLGRWKVMIVGPHEAACGGDGPEYLCELRKLAEPLGASCEFVGPVFDQDKLIAMYRASSIFIYPSLAERGEAFGLAPLEAMAAGCAVIVSSLSCFDDFVDDGQNAVKFEHTGPRPETELAEKLARLISDRAERERLASNGALTAGNFRVPAIAARMLADFTLLCRHEPSPTMMVCEHTAVD